MCRSLRYTNELSETSKASEKKHEASGCACELQDPQAHETKSARLGPRAQESDQEHPSAADRSCAHLVPPGSGRRRPRCSPAAVPPTTACGTVLSLSFDFMARLGAASASLPTVSVATDKLWDAWFTYEIVQKKVDYNEFCKCLKCGWLPAKTGSDACAKVAMDLSRDAAASHLDYLPQAEDTPLWTQERLMRECHRWSAARCLASTGLADDHSARIPVDLVPPIFYSQQYAADAPCNTEAIKRGPSDRASRKQLDRSVLQRIAQLVYDGQLDIVSLRNGSADQRDVLDDLLQRCGAPPKEQSSSRPNSKKREWLLRAWDTLAAGDSHCHVFVSVKKGTGGTVTLSCPHGVVVSLQVSLLTGVKPRPRRSLAFASPRARCALDGRLLWVGHLQTGPEPKRVS